jgi:hypothetical protein
MKRTVEILFSDSCPYVTLAIQRVLAILRRRGPEQDIEVRLVRVESLTEAMRRRLRASPVIRVDGRDIPSPLRSKSASCVPPAEWIARALGLEPQPWPLA